MGVGTIPGHISVPTIRPHRSGAEDARVARRCYVKCQGRHSRRGVGLRVSRGNRSASLRSFETRCALPLPRSRCTLSDCTRRRSCRCPMRVQSPFKAGYRHLWGQVSLRVATSTSPRSIRESIADRFPMLRRESWGRKRDRARSWVR